MSVQKLRADGILERLERLVDPETECTLAFDADGTLWTGDVGEMMFEHVVERGLLRDEPLAHLRSEARQFGVSDDQGPNQMARALYMLYRNGAYPERRACEMMVWCYAGMSEGEVGELAEEALETADFSRTINESVLPLLDWARARGLRAMVISASPALVVNAAASRLGFSRGDVQAGRARIEAESIAPTMAEALPYGPGKVEAGRRAMGSARWLASLGDSVFDLDMMRAAELAIGVRPKPELEAALVDVPGAVVLRGND